MKGVDYMAITYTRFDEELQIRKEDFDLIVTMEDGRQISAWEIVCEALYTDERTELIVIDSNSMRAMRVVED